MKKTAAIVLALAMVFTLCACDYTSDTSEKAPVPKYGVCIDFSNVQTDEVWDEEGGDLIFYQSICVPELSAAGSRDAVDKINYDIAYGCKLFGEGASALKNAALSVLDEDTKLKGGHADEEGAKTGSGLSAYVYRTNAKLTRGDVGVVSLSYDVFTYSGGVHGYVSRTSVSYDAKSGEKLSLENISNDTELLNQLIYGYILNISTGEKYKDAEGNSIFFNPDLTESLKEMVEGDNWYFSSEGLVFFANPYELAPYSCGRVDFTVPYAALDGLLKDEYFLPELEGENGMMLANNGDEADVSGFAMQGKIILDDEGQSVIVSAEDTVYYVQLVAREGDNSERLLWYRSYMTTGDAVELVSFIPDVEPNVLLRYTLADGTVIERGIFQSGKDGSIILTDPVTELD